MEMNRWMLAILMVLHLTFLASHNIYALTSDKEAEKTQQAKSAFNEIVELWYEHKFDSLYDKFADRDKSALSKEKFISRITNEKKRLACCWQKVQDVKVKLYSSGKAVVSAKLGFEDQSNDISYVNAEVPLYLKDEGWKIKVKDMLAASPDMPKHKSKKHIKIK
ncbi:MAG: NTF2-like N-terminal transpeptidase domain-containing protein [Deltaproteobacteria bacterium]|nr:NTF2-like N-terminal transpeptidase domain-containing protein [Deltaproteobacteria bacterium]